MEFLYKKFDAENTKRQIKWRIKRAEISTRFVDWVLAYAEEKKGNQLNKRIYTAMKEAFPEYSLSYDDSISQKYICVWGNGIRFANAFQLFLGYESDKIIDPEVLKERMMPYYLDRDRLPKYNAALEQVDYWINEIKDAQAAIEAVEAEARDFECEYTLEAKGDFYGD